MISSPIFRVGVVAFGAATAGEIKARNAELCGPK
jgi:hypothetical protein